MIAASRWEFSKNPGVWGAQAWLKSMAKIFPGALPQEFLPYSLPKLGLRFHKALALTWDPYPSQNFYIFWPLLAESSSGLYCHVKALSQELKDSQCDSQETGDIITITWPKKKKVPVHLHTWPLQFLEAQTRSEDGKGLGGPSGHWFEAHVCEVDAIGLGQESDMSLDFPPGSLQLLSYSQIF